MQCDEGIKCLVRAVLAYDRCLAATTRAHAAAGRLPRDPPDGDMSQVYVSATKLNALYFDMLVALAPLLALVGEEMPEDWPPEVKPQ